MRDRAHLESEAGIAQHGQQDREYRQREAQNPEPVVGDRDLSEFERAAHPGGIADLAVGRAEHGAHRLLQHQRQAPGRQQRLQRAAVEKANDASLNQDTDRTGDDEGQRHGDEQRVVEQRGIAGADGFLHHEGDIGPDHDHLAVRHVDDAHHPEGDGQTNSREQQNRTERQPVPGVLHGRPQREVTLNGRRRIGRGARDRRRLIAGQPGQQRQRFLIAPRLDGGDGLKLFGVGGVFLEQQDRRARLGKRQLRGLVGLLLEGAVDHRQHGLVMGLEHRLRGLDAPGGIGRQQRQTAERGLDGAAQTVVEPYSHGAVGDAGNRRAGRGVDALAVGLGDIDFLGVGIGHQPAVLERTDDGVGERIAAGGEHADGFFGIGKFVVCEFADRVFERPGHGRKCRRDHQQYCEWERTEVSKNPGKHWTTPAGVGEGGYIAAFSGLL